eukprot:388467_1
MLNTVKVDEEKEIPIVDNMDIEVQNTRQHFLCRYFNNMTTKKIMIILTIISILFTITTIVVLSPYIKKHLIPLFNWFTPIKWKILPLIMLLYSSWTILTIPAEETWAYLIGFFYGFWAGWIIVLFTSFIACCIAFLISRYVLKKYIFQCKCCKKTPTNEDEVEKMDKWFSYLVERHGFLAVLAIRFFILPPATWTNHIFAHTQCPFKSFALATFIGKILQSSWASYIGSQLKNIFQVTDGGGNDSILKYVIPGVFASIFVIISIIIGCLSRKWLKKEKDIYDYNQNINAPLSENIYEMELTELANENAQ